MFSYQIYFLAEPLETLIPHTFFPSNLFRKKVATFFKALTFEEIIVTLNQVKKLYARKGKNPHKKFHRSNLNLSLTLTLSLYMYISLSFSIYLSLSISLSLSFLTFNFMLYMSRRLSLSIYLYLALSLYD